MLYRRARAPNGNALHLLWLEAPPLANFAQSIERCVIGADAGIKLDRDAHGLKALAKAGRELSQIKPFFGTRKCRAETAIRIFEYVGYACEAAFSQGGCIEPALCGASGMHSFHH